MPVKGIQRVKLNIGKIADATDAKTERAIYAVLSQGGAIAQTMVPVDTSNLINSQSKPEISKTQRGMTGRIGYTAEYAAAVHEAPGTLKGQPRGHFGETTAGVAFGGGTEKGTYWAPDAEPKFLTKGFEELKPSIPALLKGIYRA